MLIDGEKWACDACVRGHRVSNCNHYERPLTHINKKGRPVSQCPHCRGLRKARSSHVKCECGDKPHTKNECSSPEKHVLKHGQNNCCCSHGNRCTCSHKKEHLSAIPEKKPSLMRSRSQTDANKPHHFPLLQGDNNMAIFQNGHHKPLHHRNFAGHECGLPYKIPRPHSIHGGHTSQGSTDSLPLLSSPYDMFVQEDRMARSEHGSPALPPKVDMLNQLPQLDLSYGVLNTDIASSASSPLPEELAQPPMSGGALSYFSGVEDQAPLSAMSGPPVDWQSMGLPMEGGNLSVEYNQARSYTSYEQPPTSHPGLGPASSGDISDTEDYLGSIQSPALYCGSPFPNAENNVMGSYNMSSDSLVGQQQQPPTSMPMSANLNPSMEQFIGSGAASPAAFSDYAPSPQLDQEPFGKPAMALHDMQKLAHPGLGIESARGPSPPMRPTSDPSWAGPSSYTPDEANFMPTSAGFQPQASWASC